MDFGISQEGCFDRAIMVQGWPGFRDRKHGFAVQNVPHIFFLCLSKRKRAGHGTKEKALRDELPGKAVNSPKTGTGRHELLTELETPLPAALYLNLNQCAAASAGMEHNGVQIGHPLLLFPLPLIRICRTR